MEIAVDNFRSFSEQTDFLCSSDLNVFIGKNSSGKSSLLRIFPLLKQTFSNDTSVPFLWYSPDYVDFGDYENVLGIKKDGPVYFYFTFDLDPYFFYSSNKMYNLMLTYGSLDLTPNNYFDISSTMPIYKVELRIDVREDYISSIVMYIGDVRIDIDFNKHSLTSFLINNFNSASENIRIFDYSTDKDRNVRIVPHKRNLLTLIRASFRRHYRGFPNDINNDINIESNNSIPKGEFSDIYIGPKIVDLWNEMFLSEDDFEFINSYLIDDFLNLDVKYLRKKILSLLVERDFLYEGTFNDFYSKDIEKLIQLYIAYYSNDFLIAIDKYLEEYFSRVKYIAPLRAPVQRYYRLQGISLSEVDPSGLNIPMIIANMNDREFRKFKYWTEENFGFYITREMTPGHVSILIGVGKEEPRNIIDLGFGYSQILPIIVELWHSTNRSNNYIGNGLNKTFVPYTIVIEQPELHLHPAMQADFIDACIKIIDNNGDKSVKFIIETHSETIVNRISESIKKERLKHDSVTINIVNRNNFNQSTVKAVGFDEDGDLLEWPIGFFTAEPIDYDYKY